MSSKYETNTPQIFRLKVIDACLRNTRRKWTDQQLKAQVEEEMEDSPAMEGYSISKGYSQRTYDNDKAEIKKRLKIISEENGVSGKEAYKLVFDVIVDKGKRICYYRYTHPEVSLFDSKLDAEQINKLIDAVSLIKQINGFDQNDQLTSLLKVLDSQIKFQTEGSKQIIGLPQQHADGYLHLENIYEAIKGENVIQFKYKPFSFTESNKVIHPYFIKQYNNRWYLLGLDEEKNKIQTFAFDRITSKISPYTKTIYKTSNGIFDSTDFFENIIGVSLPEGKVPEIIIMLASKSQAPYIQTKKLHSSQEVIKEYKDGSVKFSIRVIPNYELSKLILGFGSSLKVLEPKSLFNELKEEIEKMASNYE